MITLEKNDDRMVADLRRWRMMMDEYSERPQYLRIAESVTRLRELQFAGLFHVYIPHYSCTLI